MMPPKIMITPYAQISIAVVCMACTLLEGPSTCPESPATTSNSLDSLLARRLTHLLERLRSIKSRRGSPLERGDGLHEKARILPVCVGACACSQPQSRCRRSRSPSPPSPARTDGHLGWKPQ